VETGALIEDKRFNELLNGPLHHPFPLFQITRLSMALRFVVDSTGELGAQKLEWWCKARQRSDDAFAEADADPDLPSKHAIEERPERS